MYKEVNPAVFAIVTFPFLFGVMFGDIGHGGLLLIFGILLCFLNEKLKNTAGEAFGTIRYLILMMGLFAFYNGWIYNEFFAIPMEVFGSCYEEGVSVVGTSKYGTDPTTGNEYWNPSEYGFRKHSKDCVYNMGVDPRWF